MVTGYRIFLILLLTFNFVLLIFPTPAYADCPTDPKFVALGCNPASVVELQQLVQRVINLSVSIAFMALTAMLVYAGVKFMISGGDPKGIQAASQVATWAVIGAVLLAVAWVVLLLIKAFTGVDVTQFCLGFPNSSFHFGNNCQ